MNYNALTRQHFMAPAQVGELSGPGVFRGVAGSREQGTWVQFDVAVASGAIDRARFLAFACPHVIAVSAWLAERAAGAALEVELPESVAALSERFAVPVEKRGRLLIVEDAWRRALSAAVAAAAI